MVSGESLENRADVDVFTFTAQAGQRLTLLGERLGVAGLEGAESLTMAVWRQGTVRQPLPLAYAFPPNFPTGTFTVPETGTYEVWVFAANSTSTDPQYTSRYRGGYRVGVLP